MNKKQMDKYQDDPVNVGFPLGGRGERISNYLEEADRAYATDRLRVAHAILDLAEATIRGEGGLAAFAKIRASSVVE